MTKRPEFLCNLLQKFEIVLTVGPWNDEFVLVETVFTLSGLLLSAFLVNPFYVSWINWLLMDVIDESPFFQELMDPDDSACVSSQSFSGFGRCDILFFAQFNDVVPILLIEFFVLLELDVALSKREVPL